MKKLILFPLTIVMVAVGVSYAAAPTTEPKNERAIVQTMDAALSSSSDESLLRPSSTNRLCESLVHSPSPSTEPEWTNYNNDIPLTCEEQEWLQSACEEFEVPYALALGLIEKETHFSNVIGDNGTSTGYMQIQQKWHWNRMEHLGVTDLLNPRDNFRVGLDFLSELYEKYGDWATALTVYNLGHNPGYVTCYANTVMDNYTRWQELLENNN